MNHRMINCSSVLEAVPEFSKFCSVADLLALTERLRTQPGRFTIDVAGTSPNGVPIHHVRYGRGSTKALFVGFPHPNEPIGGLTIFSLLTLLEQGHPDLIAADVEWHVVPCIDPDGALLNEGWTQKPFSLDKFLRNSHRPELRHQVDCTFPLRYKRLHFDDPSAEAKILRDVITKVRPDFYFSLHNTAAGGGVWYCLTRGLDAACYQKLHQLLEDHVLQLRRTTDLGDWSKKFADGIFENYATRKVYDFLERTSSRPEELMQHGECSWEYLQRIHPAAFTLVTELPYLKHPSDGSIRSTSVNFRHLRLRFDADNKYIASVILEEWDRVAPDLDTESAFYKKTFAGLISVRETLHDGLPSWPYKTRDVLLNPTYSRTMTEGERFSAYLEKLSRLCQSYEFVRLLSASKQTATVQQAIVRLERVFDQAFADICSNIEIQAFQNIDLTTLAKVQLGSGLIVLDSILRRDAMHPPAVSSW